jgi:hypothetical protein
LESELRSGVPTVQPGPVESLPPIAQQYVNRLNELQSELERKLFELNTLYKTRDLDQTTYDLLRSRLAEQKVNQLISGIVDVGVPANEEQTARSRSVLRSLAIVSGEWVLLAIAIASILAYLLNLVRPSFSSNSMFRNTFRRGVGARFSGTTSD